MPSASDELRAAMLARFGDIAEYGPIQFLEGRGYTLTRDCWWTHPTITRMQDMQEDELQCLMFLVDEWDFGFLQSAGMKADDESTQHTCTPEKHNLDTKRADTVNAGDSSVLKDQQVT